MPLRGMRCRMRTSAGRRGRTGDPTPGDRSAPTWAASAAEEHPIGGVGRLVDVVVAEAVEERAELGAVARRDLHPDEHAAVVVAVVAIMEEADVPAAAHAVQEA